MAEQEQQRCPMCGKANPAEEAICKFCGARLKPLVAGDPAADPGPAKPSSGETDWLSSFKPQEDEETGDDLHDMSSDWESNAFDSDDLSDVLGDRMRGMTGALSRLDDAPADAAEEDEEAQPEADMFQTPASDSQFSEEDLSNWLSSLDEREPTSSTPTAEELPDWLQAYRSTPSESEEPVRPPTKQTGDLSDWLNSLKADEPQETVGESELEEAASMFAAQTGQEDESDLPDWLRELEPHAGADTPQEESSQPAVEMDAFGPVEGGEEELPDWLQEKPVSDAGQPASDATEPPDWLSQTDETASASAEEEISPARKYTPPPNIPATGELPDWLNELRSQPLEEQVPEEEPADAGDIQSWMASIEGGMAAEEGKAPEVPLIDDEDADTTAPFALDGEFDTDLADMYNADVPEWLADVAADETAPRPDKPAFSGQPSDEDLERADLPGWLAAMRPVDAVVSPVAPVDDDEDTPVETSGPLAGLRGVLSAETDVVRPQRLEPLSARLSISDSQARHIGVLEELLSSQEIAPPIQQTQKRGTLLYLRWGMAAALILLVLAALSGLLPGFDLPIPGAEVNQLNQTINAIPQDSAVLVAFDVEPGQSAEMDALAAPLLDHLMLRGARLTFVSTAPSGPLLAERLVSGALARHNYQAGQQYVNLGFIPGGAAGLLSFVQTPQLALPYTLAGFPAWDGSQPPLAGVNSLQDFALVLVITDQSETARLWLEQAAPQLDSAPLVMAISAQVEPLVRPYLPAGVLNGYIAGLSGAAGYERLQGIPHMASDYWDAYTLTVWGAVIILLAGAGFGLVQAVLGSSRKGAQLNG